MADKPKVVHIDTLDLAKQITVEIVMDNWNQWLWRLKLAQWLMQLAVWVGGFGGVEILEEGEQDE